MRPRVVLFGTGSPLSLAALAAAAGRAEVLGVVTPAPPPPRSVRSALRSLSRERATRPLRDLARRLGVSRLAGGPRLGDELSRLAPDLLCVASYPRLLGPELLGSARFGALGLHPSLLPRHRGPDPLFWTYLHDDREAGVTLHWLDAGEDSGDVLYQQAVTLERGRPVTELYTELARIGAGLLERALEEIPDGRAPRRPQDPQRASREGSPGRGFPRIDWAAWSAERAWHVLSGIGRWHPLVPGPSGPLRVERARLLAPVPGRLPGTIEHAPGGLRIHCRDGSVEVSAAAPRALRALRQAWPWRRSLAG